jgi:hypothetical protein
MTSEFVKLNFSLKDDLIFQIYNFSKKGQKEFYFDFKEYKLDIPFSKFFDLNRNYFFGMVEKDIVKCFKFINFPKELFDNFILKSELKNKYFDNFSFESNSFDYSSYISKFGNEEFKVRDKINYNSYINKINSFESIKLKSIGDKLIELLSNLDTKVRMVFVDSKGGNLDESSSERFVCYIYNNPEIFEKIYLFVKFNFNCKDIKEYLRLSQQIVLSFAVMNSGEIRNTIYFNVNQFSKFEKQGCFEVLELNLTLDSESTRSVWGVGIDFVNESKKYKIYYEELKVDKEKLIEFSSDFNNSLFKEYLDCFFIDILNGVLFDYKYNNSGEIISKRIDISVQSNENSLDNMFDLSEKNLYTISFEFYKDKDFKVNIYYSLK